MSNIDQTSYPRSYDIYSEVKTKHIKEHIPYMFRGRGHTFFVSIVKIDCMPISVGLGRMFSQINIKNGAI